MAVLGMRGTGTFASVERPQNWRQGMLLYFPNGDAPLTAFMSKLKDQPTDDPQYHWFEKGLPIQRGTIRGAGAADAPADDAVIAAGQTANAYLKMVPDGGVANDVSIYKVGHVVFNEKTEESMLVLAVTATSILVRRDSGDKFLSNPAITGGAPHRRRDGCGPGRRTIGAPGAIAYKPVQQYHANLPDATVAHADSQRRSSATTTRACTAGEAGGAPSTPSSWRKRSSSESERSSGRWRDVAARHHVGGMPLRLTRGPQLASAGHDHHDVGEHRFDAVQSAGDATENLRTDARAGLHRVAPEIAFCGSGALHINELAKNKASSVPDG
jgi:hypothetical protein